LFVFFSRLTDRNLPHTATHLIQLAQHELLTIRERCVALKAFEDELYRRTNREPFVILNDLLWTTMVDARDMLLIHFASWIVSAVKPGGFLKQLRRCKLAVDLVLFGHRPRMDLVSGLSGDAFDATGRYPWQYRDDAYDRLRNQRSRSDLPFNHPGQTNTEAADD
jgi:hypothetical protein